MARSRNPWVGIGFDTAMLGAEAAQVIGLRMAALAAGGQAAEREAGRMVGEKIDAALGLQALAMSGALGFTAPAVARKTLTHYRRKVRANRRRLLRAT